MPKTLITFQDFKMSQSNKVLLDNINITIHQFDRIVLVGQNGCGKSSLLRPVSYTHLTLPTTHDV